MRLRAAFIRFLLSGALNTAITYLLYLVLLQFFPYWFSYTLTFSFGIALAYFLSRYFVFGEARSGKRSLLFPVVYFFQFLVGLLIVFVWVDFLGWNPIIAPLASIAITIPITFILSKWIFSPNVKFPPRLPNESGR